MQPTNYSTDDCIAAIGSVTLAIKAQRHLAALGIGAEIISLPPKATRRGCAYGLAFPCPEENGVRRSFRAARIPISQYIKKGDIPP